MGGDSNLYAYVLNDPINNVDPFGLIVPSDKLALAANPALAAALGYANTYGRQTIQAFGAVGANVVATGARFGSRIAQGLANVGRAAQNFVCTSPGTGQAGPAAISNLQKAEPIIRFGADRVPVANNVLAYARTQLGPTGEALLRTADEYWEFVYNLANATKDYRNALPTAEQQRDALQSIYNAAALIFGGHY